jgi:peptidoglycan/xylan/chitin deacetylase (PgdA/CDA1 family)
MSGERKLGQDHPYYDWLPITKRPPLRWPNNARVALAVILNLEHWDWQLPADDPAAPAGAFRPDLSGYSQHEYGNRVGAFRILKILDKYGIKPTISMDKMVAENYPYLAQEVKRRNLEVIAHGTSARQAIHYKMSVDTERAYIRESIEAVTKATGKQPIGWLSPGFAESMNTPNLLAAEGIRYVCDWANDEQPYRMKVSQGELFSIGVNLDLDDDYIHATGQRLITEYADGIKDTFDAFYNDGAKSGRMMVINIHPWIMGWPWRSKYLDLALAHINKSGAGVWKASGHEILDWYSAHENVARG